MFLSHVEVSNFRSLKHVVLDLQEGLNVIVGRNNTGKSNLFTAIRHAIGPAGARGEAPWITRDDFYKESAQSKSADTISVKLTFEELTEPQRAHFFEIVDFDLKNISKSKAVIYFEATWPEGKRFVSVDRWGGPMTGERTPIPSGILESLPITFLPAMRDAAAGLAPGSKNRLAMLLKDLADRHKTGTKDEITQIFQQANNALEKHDLVNNVRTSLQTSTRTMAGSDYASSVIRATEVAFDRVLRTLRVQMDGGPVEDLSANGLGYNNLLYMAVVLEHLKMSLENDCPLLLVEEPEAHLHPQLTMLLAEYLSKDVPASKAPQTIVSTHSPTLAANVPPSRVHVMYTIGKDKSPCLNSVKNAGMSYREEMALQRMLDITRATLYFAKAAILVEGITETLMLPVLAKLLNVSLSDRHISVIPVCGVAFETLKKLLHPNVLGIPVAIVTDGDPPIEAGKNWEDDTPKASQGHYDISARTTKLINLFKDHESVKVYHSDVTFEFDLADAGDDNAAVMLTAWSECFEGRPGTFNQNRLDEALTREQKALCTWRGICRASPSVSKAEFAQRLASYLQPDETSTGSQIRFEVPSYIKAAFDFVTTRDGVYSANDATNDHD